MLYSSTARQQFVLFLHIPQRHSIAGDAYGTFPKVWTKLFFANFTYTHLQAHISSYLHTSMQIKHFVAAI